MTSNESFQKFYETFDAKAIEGGFRDLCWLFYSQGVNDMFAGRIEIPEMSIVDAVRFVEENEDFVENVRYWIEHPDSGTIMTDQSGRVRVTVPCSDPKREHCFAFPDRCEECGGDGVNCTTFIDLYELCGVEPATPVPSCKKTKIDPSKILTKSEIDTLVNALKKFEDFNTQGGKNEEN